MSQTAHNSEDWPLCGWALFASSTTLHLGDDDSALEGWPVTLTFADGKHGNVALLATGGKTFWMKQ